MSAKLASLTTLAAIALAASTHVERKDACGVPEPCAHEPTEGMCVRRQSWREHENGTNTGMVEIVHPDPVRLDVPIARAHDAVPQRTTVAAHV